MYLLTMTDQEMVQPLTGIPCACRPWPATSKFMALCQLHAAIERAELPAADAIWVRRVMESRHAV